MRLIIKVFAKDLIYNFSILFLIILSIFVLNAISPSIFPNYYLYIFFGLFVYVIFSRVDFNILTLFSPHIYAVTVFLLVLTLVIGQVTRGTVRWIPLGPVNLQPAEILRPFLIVFFAYYLTSANFTFKRLAKAIGLLVLPAFLILIQPSLSVTLLSILGFVGVIFALNFEKKYIFVGLGVTLLIMPLFWFALRPYQQERIMSFATPGKDPLGAGYNSVQSKIAVGSGKLFGRNLGKGVQTQLAFLPEKQTDFIFAAVSEELGFIGASLLLIMTFVLLWKLSSFMEKAINPIARAYLSGFIVTIMAEVLVHAGMNLGLLPVAGLPFPLVSAGGSSLMSTLIGLGIAQASYKN